MTAKTSLALAVVLALSAACTFSSNYDPEKYWRCGPSGYCPDGCQCLDGKVCVPQNPSREPGACAWCPDGFVDCDGLVSNGCEAEPARDPRNCGSCGHACLENEYCIEGLCSGRCLAPYTTCGSLCVDTASDPQHCGSCNHGCPGGQVCSQGNCSDSCAAGLRDCSGACVDVSSNPAHCGGCGQLCDVPFAYPSCRQGRCGIDACRGTHDNCNGNEGDGCEVDLASDPANCGSCGSSCGRILDTSHSRCDSGKCACQDGWGNCDDDWSNGCETMLKHNLLNCGLCGHSCYDELADKLQLSFCTNGGDVQVFDPACNAGSCEPVPRIVTCNGVCRDGQCYGSTCGENGQVCDPGEYCQDGRCYCDGEQCDDNETCCGDTCVDLLGDDANCGSCGHFCPPGSSCQEGNCRCLWGVADCNGDLGVASGSDGCETSLLDAENCGQCYLQCPDNTTCSQEQDEITCICEDDFFDCDGDLWGTGCESELADNLNCGFCGNVCGQNMICDPDDRKCVCDPLWADCDGDPYNGCETWLLSELSCGECGRACPYNTHCELNPDTDSPVCVCDDGYGDCDGGASNGCESCDPNCNMTQCSSELICCHGGGCVNPDSDPYNCGDCDNKCLGNNSFCDLGTCHTPGVSCGSTISCLGGEEACCLDFSGDNLCLPVFECPQDDTHVVIECDDHGDCSSQTGSSGQCCLSPGATAITCSAAGCPAILRICASDRDCLSSDGIEYRCLPETIDTPAGPLTYHRCQPG